MDRPHIDQTQNTTNQEKSINSKTPVNIIQHNCNHSYTATEHLKITQEATQTHISLLQEPYYLHDKIIGFSLTDKVIQHHTKPRSAIIIHTKLADIYPAFVTRDIVAVRFTTKTLDFYLISVYAPPHDEIENTLTTLHSLIIQFRPIPILIGGDFNAKSTVWGGNTTDHRGTELAQFIIATDLYPLNNSDSPPTFQTINGQSWIDLTLVTRELISEITNWTVLNDPSGSDHSYISYQAYTNFTTTTRKLTQKGQLKLLDKLAEDRWIIQTQTQQITSRTQLRHTIDILYRKITTLYNKYCKTVKNSTKQKAWWTQELEIERRRVRALRRRYQHAITPLRDNYKTIYLTAHKIYKTNIRTAKTKSWQTFCTQFIRSNIFTIPYKIALNRIKRPIIIPPILTQDGNLTTTIQESVQHILKTQFPRDQVTEYTQEQVVIAQNISTPPDSLDDLPFTLVELNKIIQHIPNRITPGTDNLTPSLIKAIFSRHPNLLLTIFNSCLKYSYYPDLWKESRVILIPKPDKPPHLTSSYRPICINSILGKVLEKLLNNRLYHFLHKNNLLHPKQFGFTHNTSATAALLQIKNKLDAYIQEKKKSLIVSLDITNAFNTLWTPLILNHLKRYNLHRNLYLLLKETLHNRSVKYPLHSTDVTLETPVGSPQGSPLSPLLWNILVTSLLDLPLPDNTHIQAFADDIILIVSGNTRLQLQTTTNTALEQINKWSHQNYVKFNPTKSKFILIGNHYLKRPPTIKLHKHSIRHTHELKILGIIFDHKLSFLPHATYIREKIYKHTMALASFSGKNWGFSPKLFRQLYLRSLERIITYGAPVYWQLTPNSHLLRKLNSIQRIPLLKICKAYTTVSNSNLNILTNILPIEHTLNREIALFYLFQLKQPFTINDTTYETNQIQHDINIWDTHPATLPHFPFFPATEIVTQARTTTTHNIYTDGSLLNNTVGAAYIILDKHQNITQFGKFKLPPSASIFDAEVEAIKQAIKQVSTAPNTHTFTLHSDSHSALQAIANPYNTNRTIFELKHLLQKLRKTHFIQLQHVRSHTNIHGNDIADQLANAARYSGTPVTTYPTKQYIRKQIRQQQYDLWNTDWTQNHAQCSLFKWIPSIYKIPDYFPTNHIQTQILTEHGRFPFYLQKFNKTTSNICVCGQQAQNFMHYTSSCTQTEAFRKQLRKALPQGLNDNTKQTAVADPDVMAILEAMTSYLNLEIPQILDT